MQIEVRMDTQCMHTCLLAEQLEVEGVLGDAGHGAHEHGPYEVQRAAPKARQPLIIAAVGAAAGTLHAATMQRNDQCGPWQWFNPGKAWQANFWKALPG